MAEWRPGHASRVFPNWCPLLRQRTPFNLAASVHEREVTSVEAELVFSARTRSSTAMSRSLVTLTLLRPQVIRALQGGLENA